MPDLYCGRCERAIELGEDVAIPNPGIPAVLLCGDCFRAVVEIEVLEAWFAEAAHE
jgi:hypothetical protein